MADEPSTPDGQSLSQYHGLDEMSTSSSREELTDVTVSDQSTSKKQSTSSGNDDAISDDNAKKQPPQSANDTDDIQPAPIPVKQSSQSPKSVKFLTENEATDARPPLYPKKTFTSSFKETMSFSGFKKKREERRQSTSNQPAPLSDGLKEMLSKSSSSGGSFQSQDSNAHKEMVDIGAKEVLTKKKSKSSSSGSFQSQDSHPTKEMVEFRSPSLVPSGSGSLLSGSLLSGPILEEVDLPGEEAETNFGGRLPRVAEGGENAQLMQESVSLSPSGYPSITAPEAAPEPVIAVVNRRRARDRFNRKLFLRYASGFCCIGAIGLVIVALCLTYPLWSGTNETTNGNNGTNNSNGDSSAYPVKVNLNRTTEDVCVNWTMDASTDTSGETLDKLTNVDSIWCTCFYRALNATANTSGEPLSDMTNFDLSRCANLTTNGANNFLAKRTPLPITSTSETTADSNED